jgi:murein DD-endopeptidase MepM/ murein hydrolase activator NlpD
MTVDSLPILPLVQPLSSKLDLETEKLKSQLNPSGKLSTKANQEQLKDATQQFEGLFLGYLLKVMRSTIEVDKDDTSSLGKDIYTEMFDHEIALNIAKVRSLGIGEMMYRQLAGEVEQSSHSGNESDQRQPENDGSATVLSSPPDNTAEPPRGQESKPVERPFAIPLDGVLTSTYGMRQHPLTRERQFHQGLDIAAPIGTPFRAARSGTVVFSGSLGGYGNAIVLEHGDGYRTLYGHAAKLLVSPGENVEAEQVIGIVGNTGKSTGPHLHFELQKGLEKENPREFLTSSK